MNSLNTVATEHIALLGLENDTSTTKRLLCNELSVKSRAPYPPSQPSDLREMGIIWMYAEVCYGRKGG